MPASALSLITAVATRRVDGFAAGDDVPEDLLSVLRAVTDPRCRRGVRHQLVVVLAIAVCAVLAGARSYVAIAELGPRPARDGAQPLGDPAAAAE